MGDQLLNNSFVTYLEKELLLIVRPDAIVNGLILGESDVNNCNFLQKDFRWYLDYYNIF